MTDEEKESNPHYKTTGGFLKNTGKLDWSSIKDEEIEFIKSLPNFDADILFEACGLDLRKPKTIKVNYDGQEIEIDLDKAKELGIIKE